MVSRTERRATTTSDILSLKARRDLAYEGTMSPDYARAIVGRFAALPLDFLLQHHPRQLNNIRRRAANRMADLGTFGSCARELERMFASEELYENQNGKIFLHELMAPVSAYNHAIDVFNSGGVPQFAHASKDRLRVKPTRPSKRLLEYWNQNERSMGFQGSELQIRYFFVLMQMRKGELFDACRELIRGEEELERLARAEKALGFQPDRDVITMYHHIAKMDGGDRSAGLRNLFTIPFSLVEPIADSELSQAGSQLAVLLKASSDRASQQARSARPAQRPSSAGFKCN